MRRRPLANNPGPMQVCWFASLDRCVFTLGRRVAVWYRLSPVRDHHHILVICFVLFLLSLPVPCSWSHRTAFILYIYILFALVVVLLTLYHAGTATATVA
jgi:hypothetical protein